MDLQILHNLLIQVDMELRQLREALTVAGTQVPLQVLHPVLLIVVAEAVPLIAVDLQAAIPAVVAAVEEEASVVAAVAVAVAVEDVDSTPRSPKEKVSICQIINK